MTPEQMLNNLDNIGMNQDYDDGLEGWFEWKIDQKDSELTVIWEPADSMLSTAVVLHRWKLELLD